MPTKNPRCLTHPAESPCLRALIIGASSGMGAALARRLAEEGYVLGLVARRKNLLTALSTEINKAAGATRALAYVHDVHDYDEIPGLLRKIVADLGGLDLVIYASGVNFPPGLQSYNFEGDREMLEVNLVGAFAWLNPIAEMFQAAGAGHIVGISSVAGDRGRVGNPGYNASKAGLHLLPGVPPQPAHAAGRPRAHRQGRVCQDRHAQGRPEGDVSHHGGEGGR